MTLVFGSVLAVVALVLKPKQDAEVLLEKQNFILKAALGESFLNAMSDKEVTALYNETVKTVVVKSDGEEATTEEASVNIFKEYKKPKDIRDLPVYKVYDKDDVTKIKAYVFPVYGKGLWDFIWGYVAIDADLETVNGLVLDHKGETPGLGARITEQGVQDRFAGKKIFNVDGELDPPHFQKGEGNDYESAHQVDGLSGATITAKGVNNMLDNYLAMYKSFIKGEQT
jgi:Na+-transporting NADH:ubiquinone oxidoreductase subunit C